ncbi:hypothetical protein EVAR_83180_1 [Eumeta japonica]|uniref:Uncharacterized protein n=1 Tax=Eumeta variegata TaxID=151549 RepID=A0A4C1YC92_EUMVA|nr:hypothetical protein EVAR_83180_1 [Eumeta japonica]
MILPWNLLEKQPRILNIHQRRKRVDEGREGRKLDSCVHLLGKLITEVRDLKQRRTSNNAGSSGVESATSAEVDTHLKLDTRDEVTACEERLESSAEFKNEFKLFLKNFPTGTKNSVRLETIGSGLAIEADDKKIHGQMLLTRMGIYNASFLYITTQSLKSSKMDSHKHYQQH